MGDTTLEPDETFQVQLSSPTNATLSSAASKATVTLTNDDQPIITITGNTLREGSTGTTNATVTVNLSGAYNQSVSVNYATQDGTALAGSDYTAVSGQLVFQPGETSKMISVPLMGDTTLEPDETFQVQLSNPTNATPDSTASIATVTLTNDDIPLPTLSITGNTVTEGNSGTTNATVTVGLSGSFSQPVSVNYATQDGTALAGSDYTTSRGTLTFQLGDT